MTRQELIKKLEYWASDEILPKLIEIINSMDFIFGLDDRYICALLKNNSGDEWSDFRSFCYLLKEWKNAPEIDIVDKIANKITWFHMIMGVECTKLVKRIDHIQILCTANEQNLRESLWQFRKYLSDFCSCFYTAHPYIDIYRKYAFETNPSFTIYEVHEFYEHIMKALVMYILYGKSNVKYVLKPKNDHGGIIDIKKFLTGNDGDILGYVITHNVKCFVNLAYVHIGSYEWLIDPITVVEES